MKEILKNPLTKYIFGIFIVIFLFFYNTDDVYAGAVRGSGSNFGYGKTSTTNAATVDTGILKTIFADSFDFGEQWFKHGFKYDLMENGISGGSFNVKDNFSINGAFDLICYPTVIIFKEREKDSKVDYVATGYLYLYIDQDDFAEQMYLNGDRMGEDKLPLYYDGINEEGEGVLSIPAYFAYLPLSNVKSSSGCYFSQNVAYAKAKNEALKVIKEICGGDDYQDINDFSCWVDETEFLYGPSKIKTNSQYKWTTIFAIAAMQNNAFNNVGLAFDNNTVTQVGSHPSGTYFPCNSLELKNVLNELQNKNPEVSNYIVKNLKFSTIGYLGFKEHSTIVGGNDDNGKMNMALTTGNSPTKFEANRSVKTTETFKGSHQTTDGAHSCYFPVNTAKLINGEELLESMKTEFFGSGDSYSFVKDTENGQINNQDRVRLLKEDAQAKYYKFAQEVDSYSTDVRANFIYIPQVSNGNKYFKSRYSWSATVGAMANAQDCWSPKDTYPLSTAANPTLGGSPEPFIYRLFQGKLPGVPSMLKSSTLTRYLSSYASDNWKTLSDEDKIAATLVMITFDPVYVVRAAEEKIITGAVINPSTAIHDLNELGRKGAYDSKAYKQWKKAIIQIGTFVVSHSNTSTFPHTGWASESAFLSDGGKYYCIENYGIGIIFTPPTGHTEDLLISNSYNKNNDSSVEGAGVGIKYPSSRNIIDWFDKSDLGNFDSFFEGIFPGITKGVGGLSDVPQPDTTTVRAENNYFDIMTVISNSGGKGLLEKDENNISSTGGDLNFIEKYTANPSNYKFSSIFFVGRVPEADPLVTVTLDDFEPVVTAKFNNFSIFDASNDYNLSFRNGVSKEMYEGTGTASNVLLQYIDVVYTDYNGQVLINNYYTPGNNTYKNGDWSFDVIAVPVGILSCSSNSLKGYAISGYKFDGPDAIGYKDIESLKIWAPLCGIGNNKKNTRGNQQTRINPGDVVAYGFQYSFPSYTKLESILKGGALSNSLITDKGSWKTYGTILLADIQIDLFPGQSFNKTVTNLFGEEREWEDINCNTNNDWVKERLAGPIIKNVYFTGANIEVTGSGGSTTVTGRPVNGGNFLGSNKYDFALPWMEAPEGGTREWVKTIELSVGAHTSAYNTQKVQVNCSWEYSQIGTNLDNNAANAAKNVKVYNDFTKSEKNTVTEDIVSGTEGLSYGSSIAPQGHKDYTLKDNSKLTLVPNRDVLNNGKGSSLTLEIPEGIQNQFREDWEVIKVTIISPSKDNYVEDLVLSKGGSLVGDANVCRSNGGYSQLIDYSEGSYNLYAIVKRQKPTFVWKEYDSSMSGHKWINENIGLWDVGYNDKSEIKSASTRSQLVSSCPNYSGGKTDLSSFATPSDFLIFKYPGTIQNPMYVEATFHYRNGADGINCDYEDIDLQNNSWSEEWSAAYPDFQLSVIESPPNTENNLGCSSGPGPAVKVSPHYTVKIEQKNEYFKGSGSVSVRFGLHNGRVIAPGNYSFDAPFRIQSVFGGGITLQNGRGSAGGTLYWAFNGVCETEFSVSYEPREFAYGYLHSNNKDFTFTGYINSEKNFNEKIFTNNFDHAQFNVDLSWDDCKEPGPCCVYEDWQSQECVRKLELGQRYEWNVYFVWDQYWQPGDSSVNVYVQHYMATGQNADGSTYQYEVCPCYCDPAPVAGPNNGVYKWRTEIDGNPLFYEVHTNHIFLYTTSGGGSTKEITGGVGYVYGGQEWNVWHEAWYDSDRASMPNSPYDPHSQPYSRPNGGSGCPVCNTLGRSPGVLDVPGPRHVLINWSGLSNYTIQEKEYGSPQQILVNGVVTKHFKWQPMPNAVAMHKENRIQTLNIKFCSYAFKGHTIDTYWSERNTGYSAPGYKWNITRHCYCGTVFATVKFLPARPYIASAIGSDESGVGLDGIENSKGNGEAEIRDDGNISDGYSTTSSEMWIY